MTIEESNQSMSLSPKKETISKPKFSKDQSFAQPINQL
jgi:hypothetical protein